MFWGDSRYLVELETLPEEIDMFGNQGRSCKHRGKDPASITTCLDMKRQGDVHVAGDMKVAWFKDPDGNILNIVNP